MVDLKKPFRPMSRRTRITGGAAALLLLGVACGAGAMAMTRPGVEMAPPVPTAIARLPQTSGIVTVKGKVAEVFGKRFVVQDGSGRTLVDAGPDSTTAVRAGSMMMVQGRYDNGQVRASYLVDPQGRVEAVGAPPRPPHDPHHAGPDGPGRNGPPPPPPGDNPPPPTISDGAPPPVADDVPQPSRIDRQPRSSTIKASPSPLQRPNGPNP